MLTATAIIRLATVIAEIILEAMRSVPIEERHEQFRKREKAIDFLVSLFQRLGESPDVVDALQKAKPAAEPAS